LRVGWVATGGSSRSALDSLPIPEKCPTPRRRCQQTPAGSATSLASRAGLSSVHRSSQGVHQSGIGRRGPFDYLRVRSPSQSAALLATDACRNSHATPQENRRPCRNRGNDRAAIVWSGPFHPFEPRGPISVPTVSRVADPWRHRGKGIGGTILALRSARTRPGSCSEPSRIPRPRNSINARGTSA
jgi:hypothetical protein